MEKTKIEFTATITTPDGKVITKKVVENIPSIDEYDPSDLDKFMSSFDEYERQTVKARNAIGKEITRVSSSMFHFLILQYNSKALIFKVLLI